MVQFVVGDEVFLKSGGERMTVEEVDGELISCVWFDKAKKIDRNTFPAATLKKAASDAEIQAAFARMGSELG